MDLQDAKAANDSRTKEENEHINIHLTPPESICETSSEIFILIKTHNEHAH